MRMWRLPTPTSLRPAGSDALVVGAVLEGAVGVVVGAAGCVVGGSVGAAGATVGGAVAGVVDGDAVVGGAVEGDGVDGAAVGGITTTLGGGRDGIVTIGGRVDGAVALVVDVGSGELEVVVEWPLVTASSPPPSPEVASNVIPTPRRRLSATAVMVMVSWRRSTPQSVPHPSSDPASRATSSSASTRAAIVDGSPWPPPPLAPLRRRAYTPSTMHAIFQ